MGAFVQLKVDAPAPSGVILKAEDYALFLSGRELVAQAQRQAARIRRDAEVAYRQEKIRGLQEGRKQASEEAAEHLFAAADDAINYFSGLEEYLVRIVVSGVRKVIGDLEPAERLVGIARQALSELREQKEVRIRAPTQEAAFLRKRLEEIRAPYPGLGVVDIVSDSRLEVGRYILESPMGSVEASPGMQILELEKALRRRLATSRPA